MSVEFQGNPEAFFRQCSEKASALLQADVTPIDIILTGIKEAENLPTALKYQIATDIEKEVVTQDNLMDKLHEYSAVLLGASGDIADTSANISQTDSFRSFRPRTDITQNTQYMSALCGKRSSGGRVHVVAGVGRRPHTKIYADSYG